MERMIIGICGTAESGKSTLANHIVGDVMQFRGMTDEYWVEEDLYCLADILDGRKVKQEKVKFDHRNINNDPELELWLRKELYPHVKVFSFAKPLKDACCSIFGITTQQAYFDKNDITNIFYKDLIKLVPENKRPAWTKQPDDFVTVRELLELFGSGICREIKLKCFVESALESIKQCGSNISIIDDVRTQFEIQSIKEAGGVVLRLSRGKAPNYSEKSIFDEPAFDIDNKKLSKLETFNKAREILSENQTNS